MQEGLKLREVLFQPERRASAVPVSLIQEVVVECLDLHKA